MEKHRGIFKKNIDLGSVEVILKKIKFLKFKKKAIFDS